MIRRLASGALVLMIHAYRVGLAPHLGPCCRYEPSCSRYALEAIALHGPWHGARLAAGRVLRCHPFRPGGYDPVPAPGEAGRGVRELSAAASGTGGHRGP